METPGEVNRDPEFGTESSGNTSRGDPREALIFKGGCPGPRGYHRWLEQAVGTVGAGFLTVGVLALLCGAVWIAATFSDRYNPNMLDLFGGPGDDEVPRLPPHGTSSLLRELLPPVACTVVVASLLFGIGRGLRRLSPGSRWLALPLLAVACVPPLVLVFLSIRVGLDPGGVWAAIVFVFPAIGALVLAAPQSDLLFRPEYRAWVRPDPGAGVRMAGKVVLLLFWLALFLTFLAIVSSA